MANDKEYKNLVVEYRKLAKQADQRLVRLESYQHDKHYRNILKYSYAGAMQDIKKYGGDKRFNTAPPNSIVQLEKKISDIKKFIDAPTSTKSGILKVYKKRANTLNKHYGTNFSWEDIANYWEGVGSGKFKYDPQEFKAMTAILKNKDKQIIEEIKDASSKNIKISDDEVVDRIASELIKNGITPKKYFGLE